MLKIVNPYPGFENGFYRPYLEDEHELFFGRDKDISTIKLKIRQRKLISLIAEPKMGKTSFLRSGLIPNLRQNRFDGHNGSKWRCIYMMPDENPTLALAKALVNPSNKISDKIKPSMEEEVYLQLRKNDYGLVRVIEQIIGDRFINILLVVDDFIDVFNKEVDSRERLKFIKLLYRAYQEKSLPFYQVITFNKDDFRNNNLRADPKFHKALNLGMHKLKFLDNVGLESAIMEPAKFANSEVAKDLGNEMMLMLLQDNDQLRKLQLLMSRTWLEWKRNHKDKTISKAHYFRATGQKSKAVAKGLMKGGKIAVDHLESLARESAMADNSAMAKNDYQGLSEEHKNLFKRIVPHLVDDSLSELKAVNIDRKKAVDLLGVSMEELGDLVTRIPTIIAMDRKKISINDIKVFEQWDEIKQWIRDSNALKMKFEQIADAAILHYIDGIDLQSVISRGQYKELFSTIDVGMITPSWARSQHEQYELGLDFIEKLIETYGEVAVKSSGGVKKKMSFGKKKKMTISKDVPDTPSTSANAAEDDEARLEALAILGMETGGTSKNKDESKPEADVLGETPKEEILDNPPSSNDAPLDDEDEAIKKLLSSDDDPEPSSITEEEKQDDIPTATPEKKKIALKPKGKIVLKGKESKTGGGKPKIVIKKK